MKRDLFITKECIATHTNGYILHPAQLFTVVKKILKPSLLSKASLRIFTCITEALYHTVVS